MPFKSVYECLYISTPLATEFNAIIISDVREVISLGFNRFDVVKKAIEKGLLNERIIKIVFNKAIYIGFAKPSFAIIMRCKKVELLGLLQRVETSSFLIKDRRFLKKMHEVKIKEMGV